jgi:hypothetical protein
MAKLNDLLIDLGRNADLAAAYEKDPNSVLSRYELTESEKQALLAGDVDAVQQASGLTNLSLTNSTVKSHEDK